ncbi:hypothetical protein MSAN_02371400 [Mycena sanguinolenta]|uniref:MULE transposase domain-containing protein n=1 Tax=Mycena sanguinolenta TaxID=230812 RepID=A0A8H6X5Y1_9AGAR|nr:hypothetical protein MSAN_02371400 [Mycena sanguinolenta]
MSGTKRSRSPEDDDSSRKVVKTAVGAINPVRRSLSPAIQPVRRVVKRPIVDSDSNAEETAEKPPGPLPRSDDSDSHSDTDSSDNEDAPAQTSKRPQNKTKAGSDLSIKELNQMLNNGAARKTRKPRHKKCKVILHAEVYSDDLSKIYFYQRYTHPEALQQYLDPSPYIRQATLEMARTLGLTAASIKRRLLHLFTEDQNHPTPSYRRPDASQVDNIVNNTRRKDRLLADPLLSIGVFAEHNPDKVFRYTPPDYDQDPPRDFSTGIHHPYGTQSMLLWSSDQGVGHNATYRHMNENRAPLTIMITTDKDGRMVPGFAYLSSDTTTETQIIFLEEAKRLVEQMASDLLDGTAQVADGLGKYQERLFEQARHVKKHGWRPKFFMIDKYRSSRGAIRRVFPGVPIRICQFHVMQAILRWERDGGPPGEQQARPSLDLRRKHQLLWAVREIQRCRDPDQWQEYLDQFWQRLLYITEGSQTDPKMLWDYFEANWFCDEWRELWTDMGLPEGENRDGMLSTNNWTERAFKTFNQVFLGSRNNKSIYRLVLILATEWFQYYQAWEPKKQFDTAAFKINAQGHRLWCSEGAVQEVVAEDGTIIGWRVAQL